MQHLQARQTHLLSPSLSLDASVFLLYAIQLLSRRHQLSLSPRRVLPSARQRRAARLLGKLGHARLELRPEVADEALNRPGESLTQS